MINKKIRIKIKKKTENEEKTFKSDTRVNDNMSEEYKLETEKLVSTEMSEVLNIDGLLYLNKVDNNTIDLVLTDPPYITSRKSGMDEQAKIVKKYNETHQNLKTENDWLKFKTKEELDIIIEKNNISLSKRDTYIKSLKNNYLKYGSIYGTKYAVVTNYGDWDSEFTMEKLELFINHYYRVLKNGGTLIIFFDIWKISYLKELMDKAGFKQIRFIEWIKTNPQPLNSSRNYLTNSREIALLGIKKSKPTFNSKYDSGIYKFPLQGGKNRFHPTQKSLPLFEELIKKHSNVGDIILDTFMGSGTTAMASKNTNRIYKGCEISEEYYNKLIELLK
jgi:site-specific DNA-methyltransferase (adenine-specific)